MAMRRDFAGRPSLKQTVAQIVRWPGARHMLRLAVWLFAPRHRVGVIAIVMNGQGEVLLLEHVFHPTLPWGAPGGWLARNENPAAAVERELFEETGLRGSVNHILLATTDRDPHHITIAYLVEAAPGSLRLSAEVLSARWFSPSSLPDLYPVVREAITLASQQYPVSV